jgi:putative ATP-dependent endonuclease of OLD family
MVSDGQCVRTFVADHWTLEYDLAFSGLAREVHAAAYLAINEEKVDQGKVTRAALLVEAETAFKAIEAAHSTKEARCSAVYKLVKKASKTITAQHLIDLIEERFEAKTLDAATLRGSLSKSVIHAIEYATSGSAVPTTGSTVTPVAMGTVAGTSAAVEESEE